MRSETSAKSAENLLSAYLSTFALTITNPVTILAFLGIFAGSASPARRRRSDAPPCSLPGCCSARWSGWLGISLGAGLFRTSFGERHLALLNRVSGGILTLSGLGLLCSLLYDQADLRRNRRLPDCLATNPPLTGGAPASIVGRLLDGGARGRHGLSAETFY